MEEAEREYRRPEKRLGGSRGVVIFNGVNTIAVSDCAYRHRLFLKLSRKSYEIAYCYYSNFRFNNLSLSAFYILPFIASPSPSPDILTQGLEQELVLQHPA